jgi:hypothetical protein
MDKLGKLSVLLLVMWLVIVAGLGVIITIKNGLYF